MPRPARVRRLPQRLSFSLIPAPLDLSIHEVSEKSPIPSVIVTPSSPVHSNDYAIAFLAPQPKPTLRERLTTPIGQDYRPRLRTTLLIAFIAIMLLFHVLVHTLAVKRPHLDFGLHNASFSGSGIGSIFDFFGAGFPDRRDFVVDES